MKCAACGYESKEVTYREDREWNDYIDANKYYLAWKVTFAGMYACPACGTVKIGKYPDID